MTTFSSPFKQKQKMIIKTWPLAMRPHLSQGRWRSLKWPFCAVCGIQCCSVFKKQAHNSKWLPLTCLMLLLWWVHWEIVLQISVISLRGLSQQPKTCRHVHLRHTKVKYKGRDDVKSNQMSTMSRSFKFVFNVIIDKLVAELDWRYKSYKDLEQSFGFLSNMHIITPEELHSNAMCLQKKYHTDLLDELLNSRTLPKMRKTKVP